ncbi:NAD(P)/FAD-dependent oxidoreductase [Paenibacillus albicereus]|uniref:NAD(P)/FAD-dependent oxidoreductase n=1 Tax=Paenibacillus albicereus TaxID=2726185 RepID=A0A6H2H1U4_9BACL|nr:FAD-dependent oxidoreductase [Paenibacillus albicereus]QJC53661.1 NAD(P)/FAD-dependent oxidoreductase [Paenibacillus albicereus]
MAERKERLVVAGNGMAGLKLLEELAKAAPGRYEITVYGSEPVPAYNRILLSKVLQGGVRREEIELKARSWYEEQGIELRTGEAVVGLDPGARGLRTSAGRTDRYDRLVLATGSSAFIPPIPGADKKGVIAFRSLADGEAMLEASRSGRRAAVIGGGLLGLEAARGLLHLGMEAHVVHNAAYLMNRQLDRQAARLLQAELERQGMRFHLARDTSEVTGIGRASGLRFRDGSRLQADLIVLAVGIRPNVELARAAGLAVRRAVEVDDRMRTSDPSIYAVGECAEHRGIAYGLVAPLYDQAKVLARELAGAGGESYQGSIPYSQLKVAGIEVFSVGDAAGHGEEETVQQAYDGLRGTYRRVLARDGKVTAAVLYGDASEGPALLELVRRGAAPEELAASRASGKEAEGGGLSLREAMAAALPDAATVCECNAVAKSAILEAVAGGCGTAEEVRACTGASGSCGGCRPVVEALVRLGAAGGPQAGLGGAASPAAGAAAGGAAGGAAGSEPPPSLPLPLCGCTDLSAAELPAAAARLAAESGGAGLSPRELRRLLGWRGEGGCGECRTALAFYAARHGGAASSLASAQGLGPDAVVRAGRSERRGIGEETPAPGEREAVEAADRMQRRWRRVAWPSPLRAAVSPGPDAPAGALVADIGLALSPAGWELTAGGSAEGVVRGGRLLAVAETLEEAAEAADACLQRYRAEARWGEPLWQWLERTGEAALRELLADASSRRELAGALRVAAAERNGADGEKPEPARLDRRREKEACP